MNKNSEIEFFLKKIMQNLQNLNLNIRKITLYILTEIFSQTIFLKYFHLIFKIVKKKSIILINPENLIKKDFNGFLKRNFENKKNSKIF